MAKRSAKSMADEIEAETLSDKTATKETKIHRRDLLPTGSTLLNLACSDNPFGGFLKGKYYWLVGGSTSGKTFFSMTCFAEACSHPSFKNYRIIYDNVEDGMLMDVDRLFGSEVKRKIEAPATDKDGDVMSFSIEDFQYNVDDAIKKGKPFIYVLDSMDSLSSHAEVKKFEEHKKAHREDKKSPGSYGDGKAKKNSEGLRKIINGLKKTGSILIIISQTRADLGYGPSTKKPSGGEALKFYACLEIWTAVLGSVGKTVKGKDRKIGTMVGIQTKKNRITGKNREIETVIYPSYGIDDIGSCIDYLVSEKWWEKETKTSIIAKEFELTATRAKLINHIEKNNLENELKSICGKCWKEIDKLCEVPRKKRYGG